VSGLPTDTLGATVGRQTPLLAVFVPLALVYIVDGRRGLRQTWPAALICGVVFAIGQFVTSNYISVPLADIVAALLSMGAVVLFLRTWQPAETYTETGEDEEPAGVRGGATTAQATTGATTATARRGTGGAGTATLAGNGDAGRRRAGGGPADGADDLVNRPLDTPGEIGKAYAPYLIIIAVFVVAQLPVVLDQLNKTTKAFAWPGLDIVNPKGKVPSFVTYKFNWLTAAGTLLLIAGLITMFVLKVSVSNAIKAYGDTLRQLATAILTVALVLALAYVMNASGQTQSLGNWMAGAGGAFALLSPILGWLGVAVTGSDTSSNSLFGALQVTAAGRAHLDATLMAASNSSGGVLGKMISPQNLAIAASAVGLAGREGDIFRKVVGWSLLFLILMCALVYLQSTAVLSWMLP
jgi:lactate permease